MTPVHSGKLTARWLENVPGPGLVRRCIYPIKNGDVIPGIDSQCHKWMQDIEDITGYQVAPSDTRIIPGMGHPHLHVME